VSAAVTRRLSTPQHHAAALETMSPAASTATTRSTIHDIDVGSTCVDMTARIAAS
jgi:hypothetical protein